MYLPTADKYHKTYPTTVTVAKRHNLEGSHGLPAALCIVLIPSQQAVQAHVAASGHLPLPLPTTCLFTHPLAAATVARGT
jgi:hypothetical protein